MCLYVLSGSYGVRSCRTQAVFKKSVGLPTQPVGRFLVFAARMMNCAMVVGLCERTKHTVGEQDSSHIELSLEVHTSGRRLKGTSRCLMDVRSAKYVQ